jgi:hypothetical protein
MLEHGFQTYDWKSLFGAPTLDTLALDENAKLAVSKPARVISAVCGTAGTAVAKARRHNVVAGANQVRHIRAKTAVAKVARKSR